MTGPNLSASRPRPIFNSYDSTPEGIRIKEDLDSMPCIELVIGSGRIVNGSDHKWIRSENRQLKSDLFIK